MHVLSKSPQPRCKTILCLVLFVFSRTGEINNVSVLQFDFAYHFTFSCSTLFLYMYSFPVGTQKCLAKAKKPLRLTSPNMCPSRSPGNPSKNTAGLSYLSILWWRRRRRLDVGRDIKPSSGDVVGWDGAPLFDEWGLSDADMCWAALDVRGLRREGHYPSYSA